MYKIEIWSSGDYAGTITLNFQRPDGSGDRAYLDLKKGESLKTKLQELGWVDKIDKELHGK